MIPRKILKKIRQIEIRLKCIPVGIICAFLLSLCACSTPQKIRPALPAATFFNWGAGCGDYLLVKLRFDDSDEMLFTVDTGAPISVISKAFEPKLGKPIGRQKVHFPWHGRGKTVSNEYRWPKLYLADTQLQPGKFVVVSDAMNSEAGGHRVAGILGMDCLQHYCIQLDFNTRTICFLNPDTLETNALGESFPLAHLHPDSPFRIKSATPQYPFPFGFMWGNLFTRLDLFGQEEWCEVDTGNFNDGTLTASQLQHAMSLHESPPKTRTITNGTAVIHRFELPAYHLGANTYTNMRIETLKGDDISTLGLRLLARNLVTLNFPNQTMYLKQQRVGPLPFMSQEEDASIRKLIKQLKETDQLPGISKEMKGTLLPEPGFEEGTFSFRPADAQSETTTNVYYRFARLGGEGGTWALQRAWRLDDMDHLIEEYPLP